MEKKFLLSLVGGTGSSTPVTLNWKSGRKWTEELLGKRNVFFVFYISGKNVQNS